MRELQLTDVATGIEEVFDDIVFLARQCRFTDCRHETEPGCAVKAAIADGRLDLARFERWRKLAAEDAYNTESLAERRARDRAFGKMVRSLSRQKQSGKSP
jgi:ribosome biogenesis GTPase